MKCRKIIFDNMVVTLYFENRKPFELRAILFSSKFYDLEEILLNPEKFSFDELQRIARLLRYLKNRYLDFNDSFARAVLTVCETRTRPKI